LPVPRSLLGSPEAPLGLADPGPTSTR
jgi:hypothetical protein